MRHCGQGSEQKEGHPDIPRAKTPSHKGNPEGAPARDSRGAAGRRRAGPSGRLRGSGRRSLGAHAGRPRAAPRRSPPRASRGPPPRPVLVLLLLPAPFVFQAFGRLGGGARPPAPQAPGLPRSPRASRPPQASPASSRPRRQPPRPPSSAAARGPGRSRPLSDRSARPRAALGPRGHGPARDRPAPHTHSGRGSAPCDGDRRRGGAGAEGRVPSHASRRGRTAVPARRRREAA